MKANTTHEGITIRGQDGTVAAEITPQYLVEEINKAIDDGYLKAREKAGEIMFETTNKGNQMIEKFEQKASRSTTQSCGVSKVDDEHVYLNNTDTNEIQFGLQMGSGTGVIAAAIAGYAGTGIGAVILAVAAVLVSLGASRVGTRNHGCGIIVDGEDEFIEPQDCLEPC
ncbi:hypothetical protein EA472_08770 [Natrarchaeobius oligotrophus]|uniref:Uncharacterized protein n=1 Tax=Natrarchaeobius chitinivorans TaxID=1679083 RepID=A0A3N6MDA5_NATCH|nr:hypothetical protein EA472_08770 [Natrarchaeobius chitinivorans]